MRERRRQARVRLAGALCFRVGDRVVRAPLVDVSLSGARAATRELLWRGTYLECTLELAERRPIAVAGFVLDDTARRGALALSLLPPGETSARALVEALSSTEPPGARGSVM